MNGRNWRELPQRALPVPTPQQAKRFGAVIVALEIVRGRVVVLPGGGRVTWQTLARWSDAEVYAWLEARGYRYDGAKWVKA